MPKKICYVTGYYCQLSSNDAISGPARDTPLKMFDLDVNNVVLNPMRFSPLEVCDFNI